MRRLTLMLLAVLTLSAPLSLHAGETAVLESPTKGAVKLQGIDAIRFAPEGVLLIADGKGGQIVAVDTGDLQPAAGPGAKIANLTTEVAGRLGSRPNDVEILDLAVNPQSSKAYLAVRKQDEKRDLIVTIDPAGKIDLLSLDAASHVRVALPPDEKGASVRVSDLAWAGDRLIAAARANEEFASKLLIIPGPLSGKSTAGIYSAETYHVSHRQWETKAPMSTLMPYQEQGRWYIVGAFSCTPIVKYAIDDLQPGAKVKGESMLELGSGNRPLNMFTYEKDGKPSVIVNTFRFHHAQRPISPGPYWACRFDLKLLAGNEKINEKAVTRDVSKPDDPAVTLAGAFHGVAHMDRLDARRALVIRTTGEKTFDLEPVDLP